MTEDAREEQGLKVVDAYDLDDELRGILRPGEMVRTASGKRHRLPRYFYEVPSHEDALRIRLAAHFGLNEFLLVDIKEHPRLREWPRYIPCAVRHLAMYLEQLRSAAGTTVHISVNGGYRSPAHEMSQYASHHMWATAVDIYRIGSTIMNTRDAIEKYNDMAVGVSDAVTVLPWGHDDDSVDDHIHVAIGYLLSIPDEVSEDRMEVPQQEPRFAFEDRRRGDRRT